MSQFFIMFKRILKLTNLPPQTKRTQRVANWRSTYRVIPLPNNAPRNQWCRRNKSHLSEEYPQWPSLTPSTHPLYLHLSPTHPTTGSFPTAWPPLLPDPPLLDLELSTLIHIHAPSYQHQPGIQAPRSFLRFRTLVPETLLLCRCKLYWFFQ